MPAWTRETDVAKPTDPRDTWAILHPDTPQATRDGRVIPSLRERKDDILFFAEFFLQKANQSLNKRVQTFSPEVQQYLSNYPWYGNLRELNNVVKRAVLLTIGETVQPDSLPTEIVQTIAEGSEGDMAQENVGLLKSIAWTAERQAIIDVLEKVNYNKSRASELLNIDRKTLYNKLKLYTIAA